MVPPNWEHPKTERYDPIACEYREVYKALHDDYPGALKEFADDIEEMGLAEAIDFHGGGPISDDYVDYQGQDPTWYQVYETVSEGTPVTPPFETREELIDYLVANGDFWDQRRREEGRNVVSCEPWKREDAERFVNDRQWAPSMLIEAGEFKRGTEA